MIRGLCRVYFCRFSFPRIFTCSHIDLCEGDPAIWAIKSPSGKIHTGPYDEIKTIGISLLRDGSLDCFFAAEMVHFCDAELDFLGVLKTAYRNLKVNSATSASVWRDTCVLPKYLRSAAFAQLGSNRVRKAGLDEITIRTSHKECIISGSETALGVLHGLTHDQTLLSALDVQTFKYRPKISLPEIDDKAPDWIVVGEGSVARYVLDIFPPVRAESKNSKDENFKVVHSKSRTPLVAKLVIGIAPSNTADIKKVDAAIRELRNFHSGLHLFNLRPIGFGAPSKQKLTPIQVRESAGHFNVCWLIANHRQRRPSRNLRNLNAATVISRTVRAGIGALLSCQESMLGNEFLSFLERMYGFGLVGVASHLRGDDINLSIVRAIHSMLCMELTLHTAKRIVALCPFEIKGTLSVELGRHSYNVQLIKQGSIKNVRSIVVLAVGLELSTNSERNFADFCLSLLAGYGWIIGSEVSETVLLVKGKNLLLISTMLQVDSEKLSEIANHHSGMRSDLLVITAEAVSPHREMMSGYVRLIHYSQISAELGREATPNPLRP